MIHILFSKSLDTTRAMVFSGNNVVEVTDWAYDSKICTQENSSPLVKGLDSHGRKGAVGGLFQRKFPVLCGGTYRHSYWGWKGILPWYKHDDTYYGCTNLVTGEDFLKSGLKEHRIFSTSVMLDNNRMLIIGGQGVK